MAESTRTNSTWRYVHGDGAAHSSSTPCIIVNFDVVCTRESGSQEVKWEIQNMDWDHWNATRYGYYIKIYVAVNPVDPYNPDYDTELSTILKKDTLTASNWWNYVTLHNPSWDYQKFNSTSTTGTCYIYAEVTDCCRYANNTIPCYYTNAGAHFCLFDSFSVTLPTYETTYPVTYDANGGSPTPSPNPQYQSNITNLQITPTVPGRSGNISYYYGNTLVNTQNVNIPFTGWKCSADNQTYNYPNYYTLLQSCTMTAQWGNGTYTVLDEPDKIARITYYYNGGSGVPYTELVVSKQGWNTSSAGTGTSYVIGTTYNDFSSSFNLYAMYGNASISESALPNPVRSGYVFGGWYTDPAFVNKVIGTLTIYGDANLYAKWIALPVHIKSPSGWSDIGPYVWKYSTSDNKWHKVAHIFKADNNNWIDISQ